jgi:hypothetical protein
MSSKQHSGFQDADTESEIWKGLPWFASESACVKFLAGHRWPDGVVRCPVCSSRDVRFLESRQIWECKTKHPKTQFSVRVGTILEDSHVSLGQWLTAIWSIANSGKRISSYEMARHLGVTQKSAWFMLRRINCARELRESATPVSAALFSARAKTV